MNYLPMMQSILDPKPARLLEWNQTALAGAVALVMGYGPVDQPAPDPTPEERQLAADALERHLRACLLYQLCPDFLLQPYGRAFKRARRVARKVLDLYRADPTQKIAQEWAQAELAKEGLEAFNQGEYPRPKVRGTVSSAGFDPGPVD